MNDVLFSIDGFVATITLNRPQKLNAVTPEMADAIVGHAATCNESGTIRAVILTGAGEKACQRRSDSRPAGQSKSRPVGAGVLG